MNENYLKKISEYLDSIDANLDNLANPEGEHPEWEVDILYNHGYKYGFDKLLEILEDMQNTVNRIEQRLQYLD